MSADFTFTKENLDAFLRALGKEYRKQAGKGMPAELILIGGASVLANYSFREMTYDVDAIIRAASAMKDAINTVGDDMGLPNGWLNTDFSQTRSYSPKLVQYSTYYKTFANVLTVRTVSGEYLVAMKLMAGRRYKHDISDIIGILREQKGRGKPLDFAAVDRAVKDLYGGWEALPAGSKELAERFLAEPDLERLFFKWQSDEQETKELLVDFEVKYPGTLREDNLQEMVARMKEKKARETQGRDL